MDRRRRLVVLAALVLLSAGVLGARAATADRGGSATVDGAGAYPGNTLVSVQSYGDAGRLLEVTPAGEVVWEFDPPNSRVFDAERLADGNVLVSVATRRPAADCPAAHLEYVGESCVENRVLELDGDSLRGTPTVVWSYTWLDEKVHNHEVHDADRLPSGETAVVDMGNDRVFTVARNGTVTWQWNATAHLGRGSAFAEQYGGPERPGGERDWTHANDVDRLADGTLQVSVRNFDVVLTVDPETDEIIDVLGRPGDHDVLHRQHNPHRLERWGTVLVADSENDRVVELDADNGSAVWTYGGDRLVRYPRDADRLPNGNTLIADSFNDRVIEVNAEGEVVWSYEGVAFVYSADRLSVPEEGGDTVPGWRLESRTAASGEVVGFLARVESWAAFVAPAWVGLPELAVAALGALASLWLLIELLLGAVVRVL